MRFAGRRSTCSSSSPARASRRSRRRHHDGAMEQWRNGDSPPWRHGRTQGERRSMGSRGIDMPLSARRSAKRAVQRVRQAEVVEKRQAPPDVAFGDLTADFTEAQVGGDGAPGQAAIRSAGHRCAAVRAPERLGRRRSIHAGRLHRGHPRRVAGAGHRAVDRVRPAAGLQHPGRGGAAQGSCGLVPPKAATWCHGDNSQTGQDHYWPAGSRSAIWNRPPNPCRTPPSC